MTFLVWPPTEGVSARRHVVWPPTEGKGREHLS